MTGASICVLGLLARGLMTVETFSVVPIAQNVSNPSTGLRVRSARRLNDLNWLNRERGEIELNGAPFDLAHGPDPIDKTQGHPEDKSKDEGDRKGAIEQLERFQR